MPRTQPAPQPWPTLVILALATGGFAIGTTEFATMSLVPDFAATLHTDAPTAGHVISAYALRVVVGASTKQPLSHPFVSRRVQISLAYSYNIWKSMGSGEGYAG